MAQTHNEPSHGMTLYRLRDAAVIARVMQELVEQQAVLSLYAAQSDQGLEVADHAPPLALASLRCTDVSQSALVLQIPRQTQPMPPRLIGIANMGAGVRVQCAVEGTWNEAADAWVLQATWPDELLQLQRRRHQRFPVPLGQNYTASFMFGRKRCVLDIDDLSLGGIALRGTRADTAMLFLGRELPQVTLKLANHDILRASLKVRLRRSYRSFLLGEQVLVGCSIESMDEEDRASLHSLLAAGVQMPQA